MVVPSGSTRSIAFNESAIVKHSVHFMTLDHSSMVGGSNNNANMNGLDSMIIPESSSRNEVTRRHTSMGNNNIYALAGGTADDCS